MKDVTPVIIRDDDEVILINQEFEKLENRINAIEERIDNIHQRIDDISRKITFTNGRLVNNSDMIQLLTSTTKKGDCKNAKQNRCSRIKKRRAKDTIKSL